VVYESARGNDRFHYLQYYLPTDAGVAPKTSKYPAYIAIHPAPRVAPFFKYVSLLRGGTVTGKTPVSWAI